MIRDRDCPRCYGSLEAVWDGPDQVLRCDKCGHIEHVDPDPAVMSELRRAALAVRRLRNVAGLDERRRVLAELRLVEGRRLKAR